MARVASDEVLEILDTELEAYQIDPYITSASVFIDSQTALASLDESLLKEMERWLAAHMVASTKERQSKEEGAGGAYIKYAGYWALGLDGTSYGQTLLALDPTGTFSNLSKRKGQASTYAVEGE
jgi:hypothetical protein